MGGARDPRDILGFAACLFLQRLPGDTDHIDHLLIIKDCLVIQIILIICSSSETEFWWQESAIIILIIVHYALIIDHMLDWLCYYTFIMCLIDYAVKRWSHAWLIMLLQIDHMLDWLCYYALLIKYFVVFRNWGLVAELCQFETRLQWWWWSRIELWILKGWSAEKAERGKKAHKCGKADSILNPESWAWRASLESQ